MPRTKLLLITLSEHGQANTILALLQELQTRQNIDVHIVSYPEVEKRVQKIVATQKLDTQNRVATTFHALSGPTSKEIYVQNVDPSANLSHPPTSRSFKALYNISSLLTSRSAEQYIDIMNQVRSLIGEVSPDLIVVDSQFIPAMEACRLSGRKWIVNSPMQVLDFLKTSQPWLKWIWHYPALFSGYRYPLSWRDMLSTIYINIMLILISATSSAIRKHIKFRKDNGLEGKPQWMSPSDSEFQYICPSIVETDFPFVVPPSIKLCGPIVLDSLQVEETDPELFTWLNQGTTIYISFGTHSLPSEDFIRGLLGGLLIGLPSNVQVLWKLKKETQNWETIVEEVLSQDEELKMFKTGRLRIVDWIVPDPLSIIQHPNVKCFVHHGGANSFFEGCLAGVPQIIIAQWYNLYDNAVKAEYRGFGIYGNREAAPSVEAKEFGKAVQRIMGDTEEAILFRERAEWVGQLCRKAGGRKTAVDHLLNLVKASGHPITNTDSK